VPLFDRWRADRELHRKAGAFVLTLCEEPSEEDVAWLVETATQGDEDHARWELRYARRALGLVTAQRDALDDQTASAVGHALAAAFEKDPAIAPGMADLAERQFNARLSAYRDALGSRSPDGARVRLGRTLLGFAGDPSIAHRAPSERAGSILTGYLAHANDALGQSFGIASLPEHARPSEIGGDP